jgi:hypothetical protein
MKISIFNFKVKLFQQCIGTFSARVSYDDFDINIHNISLYIWGDGTKQIFFPSNYKKEFFIESEDIIKFIKEELINNFLNTYLYFKNSIHKEKIIYIIDINLESMLVGTSINLFEYESEINEELEKFKAECNITNEEIHISYSKNGKDEDCRFEILNTIFKYIEDKNPSLRENIKIKLKHLNKNKEKLKSDDYKYQDTMGYWRDKESHELIHELLPDRVKNYIAESYLK